MSLPLAVALLCTSAVASAQERVLAMEVFAAWSRELPPVSANGAAYVTLVNRGTHADALVGARTGVAERAEIHEHTMHGGVMRMQKVDSVALEPSRALTMAPGGMHVMLIGLHRPLRRGDRFPLTLQFAHAPPMELEVEVRAMGAGAPDTAHMHGSAREGAMAGHGRHEKK